MATGLVATQAYASTPIAQVGAVATSTSTSTSTPTVLSPEVTSLSAAETSDPLRGQYRWMGYGSQPSTWPATDVYYRDQTYWGRLEPTKGVYDFKWIEDGLKKAGETKGKFGFRVMAWCPECWMTARTDKIAFPSVLPSYIPVVKGVPNWNSEAFLSGYERLMAALGAKYANDPRLGYVDVGGYGKFGEWWVGKDDLHITEANGLRLVRAVNKAFPKKIILFNTMQSVDFTLKALATNPRMGMRTDSLGEKNMYSMAAVDTRLQSFWKTRPFFTEWATSGDPVAAAAQVKQFHLSTISSGNLRLAYSSMTSTQQAAYRATIRSSGYRYYLSKVTMKPLVRGATVPVTVTISNVGVAPTYEDWNVHLRLTDANGKRIWTKYLWVDLKKVLPGTQSITSKVTVPSTLPRGTYTASLAVVDREGYSDPMYLADYSRDGQGGYTLGSVTVR
jgi:hypothetical protein